MKQPKPLPSEPPFITFYTPTRQRPQALAKCMRSVSRQTAVEHVEHLVLPDYVGYGIAGGLYGRIPWYAQACRGEYVHILADDDELIGERAVEDLMKFARKHGNPPVIMVGAIKNGFEYPSCNPAEEPKCTQIDLGCYVLRQDVWRAYCHDYGKRYEGDYDHAKALWDAGYRPLFLDMDFVEGGASNGRPEAVDW